MLENLDALVIDLQDVGARYYTFIWTMYLAMRACEKAGLPVLVLDRPNPINGVTTEGPMLDPAYQSLVGLHPLPVRHGKTIGELARLFRDEAFPRNKLTVLPMKRWDRAMWFDQTGLPWVMPSPNMPTLDTATVYPGMCLLEGTNISEGRGTTRPFEIFGAPFIEAEKFFTGLNALKLPGVFFRENYFQPTFQKLARRPQGHDGEYFVVCTLYYTPKESGFTFERGFDATPVTKPGLRGRTYPRDFLRSVKKEGFGQISRPVNGKHYISYAGGGSYAFASHPTGGGGVLVARYSAAIKSSQGSLRHGAIVETFSPEVQKVFRSNRWRIM